MRLVDIIADLNDEDEAGYVWTFPVFDVLRLDTIAHHRSPAGLGSVRSEEARWAQS
jgi:hypothetical protein